MPQRTKIDLLPQKLRDWLRDSLEKQEFASYEDLAQELEHRLAEQNLAITISPSTLHRWGSEYRKQLDDLEKATRFVAMLRDKFGQDMESGFTEAILQMLQSQVVNLLLNPDRELQVEELTQLIGSVTRLSGAAINLKKYKQEIAEKAAKAADEVVNELSNTTGLTDEAAAKIRAAFLGIPNG